jgi:cardiolipin synthase (CMP-forming)
MEPRENIVTIPNLISAARLLMLPVMGSCLWTNQPEPFKWLLLAALLSDILDGAIARLFHMESKLGSVLDAMADTLLYLVVIPAIVLLQPEFLRQQAILLILFFAVYLAEKVKTFLKFRKFFNSFHNYSAKAMGYVQGAFILSLFFFGFVDVLFYVAVAVGILASVEDMIVSSLVSTYETDTKGLYWVLKKRRLNASGEPHR